MSTPVVLWDQGILVPGGTGIPEPPSQGCQGDPPGSWDVREGKYWECGLENSYNPRFPKATLATRVPRDSK